MKKQIVAALCGVGLGCAGAFAGISRLNVPFPGGFGQAAAFSNTNGTISPGNDLQTMLGVPKDFQEALFGPGGSTSVSAAYQSGQISNSVGATYGFGYLTADAADAFPDSASFSAAAANGGWKETFTVSHPTLTGQSGYMVFRVHGKGNIVARNLTGSGYLIANPFKDNVLLSQNMYFDRGDSDLIGTSNQYARWAHASFGTTTTRAFDGITTFSVPVTFGTSFSLGVYAMVVAGQRSSGGLGGTSSATIHAEFNWDGLVGVFNDAGPIEGATVTSESGKDWRGASGACPSDLNGDGLVDDSDFTLFVAGYNILDCADPAMPAGCPADVNGDGLVDDADFVVFVVAYNALVCS